MPFVAPVLGAVASTAGAVASGVAGLASAAASAVSSVASGILGGAAKVVGGAVSAVGTGISALTGGQAAVPVTVGGEMGSLSAVSEAAALGVPAATTGVSTIASAVEAGVGIYGTLAQIELAKDLTEAQKIQAQEALIKAEAQKVYETIPEEKTPLPTLAAQQQPVFVTAPVTKEPNYLLYIGLAIAAILILRKK